MAFLSDDFRRAIAARLPELEAAESTVVGVRADLTIAYVNPAWDRFALANGGEALVGEAMRDVPLLDHLPAAIVQMYREALEQVLATERSLVHDYECSSATTHRDFRLRFVPVSGGLLMVHHLTLERPHGPDRSPSEPDIAAYETAAGVIAMCAHCQLVRRGPVGVTTWDWVPAWVEHPPPNVSHSLCSTCLREHYPRFSEAVLSELAR